MRIARWVSFAVLGIPLLLIPSSVLRPDAIVVTRAMLASTVAEVFIEEDSILVELEIGVRDLDAFRNLLPDELYQRLGHEPQPLSQRIKHFFAEDLTLKTGDGPPVAGRVLEVVGRRRVVRDEITGQPLPVADQEGEPVVFVRLVYPLGGRPESLRIAPPRSATGGISANIGFVTYHRQLPVNDFRYLAAEERLALDWSDPWYSRFDNRNLRRQFYSPISVFLYIEPYEVRKEIVARPKDLQQWIDLGLEGKELITVEDQEEIKRRVAEFLAERNPVTIDGQPVDGTLDRIHFIYRNVRTSGVIDPPRDLDAISATLGVIFVYPTDGLPQEVAMEWQLFGPRIDRVPSSATDEAGPLPYVLSPDDRWLRWQNFLKHPTDPRRLVEVKTPPQRRSVPLTLAALGGLIGLAFLLARHGRAAVRGEVPPFKALGLAVALALVVIVTLPRSFGSSRVSEADSQEIVGALLGNIYRAFDYRDESRIYDVLARSAEGDLLTDIYLETRRSLELANQGGARVKVKEVEILASDPTPLAGDVGFVTRCTWNVSGSVGHWGHIHTRTNQYEARFTVRAVDGAWKITELELLQEQRV